MPDTGIALEVSVSLRFFQAFRPGLLSASFLLLMVGCAQSGGEDDSSSDDNITGTSFHSVAPPSRVTWDAPTTYNDGSPLTNLVKYRIYYGDSKNALDPIMEIPNMGSAYDFTDADRQMIGSLMQKNTTHYFAITAIDGLGLESALSEPDSHGDV